MKSGVVIRFSFFTLLVFLALLLTSLSVILVLHLFWNGNETYEHKFLRFDHQTGESSVGTKKMLRKLGNDEYISYKTNEGHHFLISSMESEQYLCTGSCFCMEDSEDDYEFRRRRSSNVFSLSKGLVFLISSMSSVMAYQLAKEHFDDECQTKMKEMCPNGAIHSMMGGCKNCGSQNHKTCGCGTCGKSRDDYDFDHMDPGVKRTLREKEAQREDDYSGVPQENVMFHCHGQCVMFEIPDVLVMNGDYTKAVQQSVEITSRSFEKELFDCKTFSHDRPFGISVPYEEYLTEEGRWDQRELARMMFMLHELHPYCAEISTVELTGVPKIAKGGFFGSDFAKNGLVPRCGGYIVDGDGFPMNPNVDCVDRGKADKMFGFEKRREEMKKKGIQQKWDQENLRKGRFREGDDNDPSGGFPIF